MRSPSACSRILYGVDHAESWRFVIYGNRIEDSWTSSTRCPWENSMSDSHCQVSTSGDARSLSFN